jgi:hypothetical protein
MGLHAYTITLTLFIDFNKSSLVPVVHICNPAIQEAEIRQFTVLGKKLTRSFLNRKKAGKARCGGMPITPVTGGSL